MLRQGLALLKAAWDMGINTVDTANSYSNGESEKIVGEFLTKVSLLPNSSIDRTMMMVSQYNIPRDNMVILTKINFLVGSDPASMAAFDPTLPNTREYVNQGGLSRSAIFNQVDACLRRLKTTYIDVLQIHAFDPATPFDETMKALHDLVVGGKVRYLGASNLRAWQLAEMNHTAEIHGWTQFTSMQLEHSLLYRTEVGCRYLIECRL